MHPVSFCHSQKTMARTLLKLSISALALSFWAWWHRPSVAAYSASPPPARTGAPGESTCVGCHNSYPLNSGPGVLSINGLPDSYTPNQEIAVTVRLSQADRKLFGFQLTVLDDSGKQAGALIVTDDFRTQREVDSVGGQLRFYLQHTLASLLPAGPDFGEWSFKWRAPAQAAGRVTFYAVGNASNGNGGLTGDYIYTTSASVRDEPAQTAYEADVAPRPDGNRDGAVTTADWEQVGRFVTGLEVVSTPGEFQRADCAPAATRGDGRISVADWVQAGRYAAGLDAVVTAGGPLAPLASLTPREFFSPLDRFPAMELSRLQLRSERGAESLFDGQRLTVQLDAQGVENAMSFSLAFDARYWRAIAATPGPDAAQAQMLVNAHQLRQGRLGFVLALPAGATFAPGWRDLLTVTFTALPWRRAAPGSDFQWADEPVGREIANANLR